VGRMPVSKAGGTTWPTDDACQACPGSLEASAAVQVNLVVPTFCFPRPVYYTEPAVDFISFPVRLPVIPFSANYRIRVRVKMAAPGSRWRRELLPHMVDRLAREEPHALYGIWPVDPTSYAAGLQPINFAQLANVVNGLAAWIVEHVGPSKGKIEALAYIGPNDVRNNALALAAVKAGYVVGLQIFASAVDYSAQTIGRSFSTRRETVPRPIGRCSRHWIASTS
jgi:hypothetical protein